MKVNVEPREQWPAAFTICTTYTQIVEETEGPYVYAMNAKPKTGYEQINAIQKKRKDFFSIYKKDFIFH